MKLLLITSTYPTPARPQQGAFNEALVNALAARNQVQVIAPVPWTQIRPAYARRRSVESTLHPISFYSPKLFRAQYGRFMWLSVRPTIRKLAQSGYRPDVVMGYWTHPDGEVAVRAAKYWNTPSIVVSGGSDLKRLPIDPTRRQAVTRVLRSADRIVVVSEDLRQRAIAMGRNPDHVHLIRRGIRQELFHPADRSEARSMLGLPEDAVVLLWAGRLEPVKNPAMLLYAAREWKRRWGDRLRVLMHGDGSLRSELSRLHDALELGATVQMNPALKQDELAIRYQSANLTILTSHSEGVPNVLLESMACGIPFVATDVGGVSEIATRGLDDLVGDGNIQQLVEAVVQSVETRQCRPRSLQRTFVPSDIADSAKQMEALIRSILPKTERDFLSLPESRRDPLANWEAAG